MSFEKLTFVLVKLSWKIVGLVFSSKDGSYKSLLSSRCHGYSGFPWPQKLREIFLYYVTENEEKPINFVTRKTVENGQNPRAAWR